MKKGFTLLELLAVIIILAVIALIATPIVLNVIESSKKQANKNSVYGLMDGARLYYAESMLDENKANKLTGNTDLLNDIKVSGKKPEKGNIYINKKGEIALAVVYDKTCYTKNFNEIDLSESNDVDNCNLGNTPEVVATDLYAIVYDDGTLVFNSTGKKDTNKQVLMETSNIINDTYNYYSSTNLTDTPWNSYKDSITKVIIEEKIKPISTANWFVNFKNLTTIENINNLDTSDVTDMSKMFYGCSKLTTLDLSNFDTSNVTDMNYMFYNCSSLTTLDLRSFDTSKVTNMVQMFSGCTSLTALNINSFDTSNVVNMSLMFRDCASLITLDLNSFNTSKVTNMEQMFYGCSSLTTLNLSSFDTSNVTNTGAMFRKCSNLTTLDLRSFDTSKVTNMGGMFMECSKLTKISVTQDKWNTSNVVNTTSMFSNCGVTAVTYE